MRSTDLAFPIDGFDGVDDAIAPSAAPLDVVDAAALLARPYEPPRFLVEPWLPESGIVLLTGDTGSCKTAMLMHLSLCIALGRPVAERLAVGANDRPVLYCNGEMGSELVRAYLHQAAAGLGASVPKGKIFFEGVDAIATFRFGAATEDRTRLEATIDAHRPSLVVFDTQRALFDLDETEAGSVRHACRWLGDLAHSYGTCVVLAHHLRKINAVSNSDRERVAGSRDWIAAVDVHLSAQSRDGAPMHALRLGKTRFPTAGAATGTEWPIVARLDMTTTTPRSVIVVGDPTSDASTVAAKDDAVSEIRARLQAEGEMTREQLDIRSGTRKRAFSELLDAGEVVAVGNDGRKKMYALAGAVANRATPPAPLALLTKKLNNHAGSNGANAGPDAGPAGIAESSPPLESPDSKGESDTSRQTNRAKGQTLKGGPVRGPVQRQGATIV